VARHLIGCLLGHGKTAGIIVETEAYTGMADPGSHAYRGRKKRNAPMFGPPGRAYVYKCHMYPLLNVVTEPEGIPGAVLIRALIPVRGLAVMRKRRNGAPDRDLARGPGRLTQALGIGLRDNRADLSRGRLKIARGPGGKRYRIARTTRIGLKGPAARLPWRYHAANCPFVS